MKLDIRQHPVKARMCGFSALYNRGIMYFGRLHRHPPLILELQDYDPNRIYTCHVTLISNLSDENRSTVGKKQVRISNLKPNSYQCYDCLVGPQIVLGQLLKDTNLQNGLFFIFPDLSIRTQGDYRLQCRIIDMISYLIGKHREQVVCQATTTTISIYDSKTFPGGCDPTELSKWFNSQGIPIGGGPYGRKVRSFISLYHGF
jgi:hypothetical protein